MRNCRLKWAGDEGLTWIGSVLEALTIMPGEVGLQPKLARDRALAREAGD